MKKHIKTIILSALTLIFCASPAFAHRVNVYAWLDNDHVIVECNFGKDKPARAAEVTISDSDTKAELLKGKTNDSGIFTFTVPEVIRKGHGLVIDVNAGEGHHNQWTMDASELYAAASLTAGFDQAAIDSAGQPGGDANNSHPQNPPASALKETSSGAENIPFTQSASPATRQQQSISLTPEELKKIIHEAVESQIAPLRQQIAKQLAGSPSIIEIIGGLGWILGIVGIILFYRSRHTQ